MSDSIEKWIEKRRAKIAKMTEKISMIYHELEAAEVELTPREEKLWEAITEYFESSR